MPKYSKLTLQRMEMEIVLKETARTGKPSPTNSTLLYVVYRSHFMTRVWKSASKCHLHLPDPELHG